MWLGLWALAALAVCALLSLIAKRKQVSNYINPDVLKEQQR